MASGIVFGLRYSRAGGITVVQFHPNLRDANETPTQSPEGLRSLASPKKL
jgi:hypothetical protein